MNPTPVLRKLGTLSRPAIMALGLTLIAIVGLLDVLTGYELAFSLFYLIPISLLTWYGSPRLGLEAAFLSAATWLTADILAGQVYSNQLVYFWNTCIRFSVFFVVVRLLSILRDVLQRERKLARQDSLTGALNSRHFEEVLNNEMERLRRFRRPFSLVYFDIDHFKEVNDQGGHPAGNQLLVAVVEHLKTSLRPTDQVARLGGDEFAVLLPETGEHVIQTVVAKIQRFSNTGAPANAEPITFSMGALTCLSASRTPDEIIALADQLMYSVKNSGRNGVAYTVFDGESPTGIPQLQLGDNFE